MATATLSPGSNRDAATDALYAALEDRILQRDQIGASRAYYDLVRSLHPDHHHGTSPDPVRLHDVNEAWRVLRDPA